MTSEAFYFPDKVNQKWIRRHSTASVNYTMAGNISNAVFLKALKYIPDVHGIPACASRGPSWAACGGGQWPFAGRERRSGGAKNVIFLLRWKRSPASMLGLRTSVITPLEDHRAVIANRRPVESHSGRPQDNSEGCDLSGSKGKITGQREYRPTSSALQEALREGRAHEGHQEEQLLREAQ